MSGRQNPTGSESVSNRSTVVASRSPSGMHPYRGHDVVLTTKHAKEGCVARPLAVIGLRVVVSEGLDTDLLGTFTGEIERVGTPRDVVLRKARLGLKITGRPLGMASEGSYGPHPSVPFVAAGHELLGFVDDALGFEIVEQTTSLDTNFASVRTAEPTDLDRFLTQVGFPRHGLVVSPASHWAADAATKGVQDQVALHLALARAAAASTDGRALVQTDMRAHLNPTRQRVIRKLAVQLARRLAQCCPACHAPGFGLVALVRGLPCEWCNDPTELAKEELFGCGVCTHRDVRRCSGPAFASPGHCNRCNP